MLSSLFGTYESPLYLFIQVEYHASLSPLDAEQMTPVARAVERGAQKSTQYLLQKGKFCRFHFNPLKVMSLMGVVYSLMQVIGSESLTRVHLMPLKLNVEYQSQMNHNSQSQHTENHEEPMRTQKQNE